MVWVALFNLEQLHINNKKTETAGSYKYLTTKADIFSLELNHLDGHVRAGGDRLHLLASLRHLK